MSNYVYDNTALFFPKVDLEPIPGGADPAKYVQAVDWNTLNQAVDDIKGVLRGAVWIGLNDQTVDPAPSGIPSFLWLTTTNVLNLKNGGTNYPVVLGTRLISPGTGLTGGGDLSADRTLSLANTAVTPGSYTLASITVDAQGRITAASTGTGAVPTSRLVSTGTGLSGGGDLSADRTISLANTAVSPGAYSFSNITVDAQGRLTLAATGGVGSTLANATLGSVLFVNTGGILDQDNPKFFWDSTNKRLGIGNAVPGVDLDVTGTIRASAGITLTAMTLGSVLFAGTAGAVTQDNSNFFWDDTNNRLGIGNAAPGTALDVTGTIRASAGLTLTAMTLGSIMFAGASGAFTQDNANFFWDSGNARLGVGTATPQTKIHIKSVTSGLYAMRTEHTNTGGYSGVEFFDSGAAQKGATGYGNSAVAITHLQSKNFNYSTGPDWVFANATRSEIALGMTTGSTFVEIQNGSSAGVSSANTGKVRYNTTGQKVQWSFNGGSFFDVGTYTTALTTGSILFANNVNQINQDNANLFWDNTGKSFIVGAAALTKPTSTGASHEYTKNAGNIVLISSFGTGVTPSLYLLRGRGTAASTTAVQNLDSLGLMAWVGATAAGDNSTAASFFQVIATENYTGSNVGSRLQYHSIPNGSGAGGRVLRFSVDQDGAFLVGAQTSITKTGFTHEFSKDAAQVFTVSSYGTGLNADISIFRGRGTAASTTAVQSADVIGTLSFAGAQTSSAIFTGAQIKATTTEIWSGTVSGTKLDFLTTTSTTVTRATRLTIENDGGITLVGSTAAANSASAEVRLRNNGTKLQASMNAGSYFDVSTYAAAMTTGSVPFANGSNQLAQDNANFFWDSSNARLGLGTASPSVRLHVKGSAAGQSAMRLESSATDGYAGTTLFDSAAAQKGTLGYGNASVSLTHLQSVNFLHTKAPVWVVADDTAVALTFYSTSGSAGLGFANGSSLAVSASSQGRVIFNSSTSKLQVSLNTAAYVDLLTTSTGALQTTTLTAGTGLTGGGDLSASRTFNVGAGSGILSNADDVAVDQAFAFAWTSAQTWKAHAAFTGSATNLTTKSQQTTNATQTHITLFTISDTFAGWVTVMVVGRDAAGVERAMYGKTALVYRQGGGAAIQGTVQDIYPDVETSAGLDATITVSSNDVRLSVTGLAATTINWVAKVEYQQVSGNA